MSAAERRESVITAAMTEFARGGYNGTSTEAIAKRVGVSQPYLFRLFPSKRAIFLAASMRCMEETRQVLADAAEAADISGDDPESGQKAMALAYYKLIGDRDKLLMQMQTYVAVAEAEEAGDREFGEPIRKAWAEIYDVGLLHLGGDHDAAAIHMAYGMLINTLVSLGFPQDHHVWAGFWEASREAAPVPPTGL